LTATPARSKVLPISKTNQLLKGNTNTMATVTIENLTDDLDNTVTENVHTVTFFDPTTGEKFELELGEKNTRALNKVAAAFDKYREVARKVEAAPKKAVNAQKGEQAKVREWAKANGYEVGDRGRIKADVVNAYYAAQGPGQTVAPEAQVELEATDEATEIDSPAVAEPEVTETASEPVEAAAEAPSEPGDLLDRTDKMDAGEFAKFLADNMDDNGNVDAHTVS
jgi:hypothetical protein